MILRGDTLPEQLGAFLMLLRVKEESPAEIAGFVRAARARARPPADRAAGGRRLVVLCRQGPAAALVHPVRADPRAQRPAGVHARGGSAHRRARLYRRCAAARSTFPWRGASRRRPTRSPRATSRICRSTRSRPKIADMLELRPILGLRSPVHTFARHAQPVRRANPAAGRLPSGLHGDPPRRGCPARAAAAGGVPRRGRRDRAPAEQTDRRHDGVRRQPRGRALAADGRRAAPGAGRIDGPRPPRRAVAGRDPRRLRRGGGHRHAGDRAEDARAKRGTRPKQKSARGRCGASATASRLAAAA